MLRAAGGAAITLPALEIMFDRHGTLLRAVDADPEALRRLLRRPVAGRRRRSAAQRLRAEHDRRELRSQVGAGAARAGAGRRQRRVGAVDPDGERRHGPVGGTARRLPRLVAEPAAVGRAVAVRHVVGGPDVGSDRRRRDRRQHAVQVARLPRPGRVVPERVGALRPRHRSRTRRTRRRAASRWRSRRWSARRWRSTPCSPTSRRPTTPRPPRSRTSCCAAARACSISSAAICRS